MVGGGGNSPLRLTLALLALVAAAAIIAADFTAPAVAQSEGETTGRIVARLLDDGRVEFAWQPTGGARVLPRARYFPAPDDAEIDKWLRSSPVEVSGTEIGRINARLLADGRIEFAFTPTDGERIEPPARYFPADTRVGRWLRSTEIAIGPPEDAPTGYIAVSAGSNHTCAIRASGEIACWGANGFGQADAPPGVFTTISAGERHTCAIRANGEIACWGSNDARLQTNAGLTDDTPTGSFTAVSATGNYTCAIRESGEIACWGLNGHYHSVPVDSETWVMVLLETGQTDAPAGTYTAVSAGGSHACAIRTSGEIACWGSNAITTGFNEETQGFEQLHTGQATPPEGSYIAVSAGAVHTCGLREDRMITCWGLNGYFVRHTDSGAAELRETGQTDAPDGAFTAVSAGGAHTCAIRASGEITCWGEIVGQIGAPPGSYTAVSAGAIHTCGLRDTGAIECWGSNAHGQATPPN